MPGEHLSQKCRHINEYSQRIFHSINVFVLIIVDLRKKERKKVKQKLQNTIIKRKKEENNGLPSLTHASGIITASIHG